MAVFDFSKTTQNHYHGAAPNLVVNGNEADVSNNTVTMPVSGSGTVFEIFKIVLTQSLAVVGAIITAYFIYLFGFNGKSIDPKCYLPVQKKTEISSAVSREKNDYISALNN